MNLAPPMIVALMGAIVLASVPTAHEQAEHGIHNRGDDGLSQAVAALDARIIHGRLAGLESDQSLVVAGPQLPYSSDEVAHVRAFIEAGGRLLVLDDVGSGRELLERLDVGMRLAGVPVYTPVFDIDPASPVVQSNGLLDVPASLSLLRPTAVLGDGEPVLWSDEVAWLDQDQDGRPDLEEPRGSYAFAMHRFVGAGEVLVIGSADVLDNRGHVLRDGVLAWIGDDAVIDAGHHRAIDPVGISRTLAGQTPIVWLLLPAAVLVVAWQTFQVRPRRVRPKRRPPTAVDQHILQELDP